MIPQDQIDAAAQAAELATEEAVEWHNVRDLLNQLALLTSEVETLRKDKARPDWLETQETRYMQSYGEPGDYKGVSEVARSFLAGSSSIGSSAQVKL